MIDFHDNVTYYPVVVTTYRGHLKERALIMNRRVRNPDALKTIGVHPELYKALKIAATQEDQTLRERLHILLCSECNRPDLLEQSPGTITQRAAATA